MCYSTRPAVEAQEISARRPSVPHAQRRMSGRLRAGASRSRRQIASRMSVGEAQATFAARRGSRAMLVSLSSLCLLFSISCFPSALNSSPPLVSVQVLGNLAWRMHTTLACLRGSDGFDAHTPSTGGGFRHSSAMGKLGSRIIRRLCACQGRTSSRTLLLHSSPLFISIAMSNTSARRLTYLLFSRRTRSTSV